MKPDILLSLWLGFTFGCSADTTNDFKPFGNLVMLRQIPDAQSISNITLVADFLGTNHFGTLDADGFRRLLKNASPASPDLAKEWQASAWYHGSFVLDGKTNYFNLLGGGLGVLSQPDGTRGLFLSKQLAKEKP